MIPEKHIALLMVLSTVIGKFIFMDWLEMRLVFISIVIAIWVAFIIYHFRKNPSYFHSWGFRTDNFNQVARLVIPYALVSFVIICTIGILNHSINLTWHIFPILLLYPVWGVIQHYLLIGIFSGKLYDMGYKAKLVVPITAILFGVIHYPYSWLMVGTFLLALFYGWAYNRARNLYVLGIFHGWLGAVFFYFIMNRDPFLETFGTFLSH
jgi:membrane protease YdiL (CAAX protease family)